MDGATIQKRIYSGRAKAAQRIGLDCQLLRPTGAKLAMAVIRTMKAAFNSGDSNYHAPNLPGDPIWYADFDGNLTRPGDYLRRVSDGATWYIAAQEQLLPIVVMDCNRTLTVERQKAQTGVGAVGYGGIVPGMTETVLGSDANPWPASILLGGRKDAAAGLPAGVKNAGWRILLPPSVPITLAAGDIAVDDLGRRYVIDAAELTELGWRMTANEAHT